MSDDKKTFSVKLVGGNTILTVAFFAAKVTGYINWSWIWVFSPIWIPLSIVFGMLVLFVILSAIK